MTREQHLQWCRERAREYLEQDDARRAVASLISDLTKHPQTRAVDPELFRQAVAIAALNDVMAARRLIARFK